MSLELMQGAEALRLAELPVQGGGAEAQIAEHQGETLAGTRVRIEVR